MRLSEGYLRKNRSGDGIKSTPALPSNRCRLLECYKVKRFDCTWLIREHETAPDFCRVWLSAFCERASEIIWPQYRSSSGKKGSTIVAQIGLYLFELKKISIPKIYGKIISSFDSLLFYEQSNPKKKKKQQRCFLGNRINKNNSTEPRPWSYFTK